MTEMTEIDKIVDEATAGLFADAELRLDAAAELRSHLEDSVDTYQRQGKTEQESISLALKDFGNAAEVAEQLADANTHRMKMNGIIATTLRCLVMPTAVLLAVLVAYSLFVRYNRIVSTYDMLSDTPPALPSGARWQWQKTRLLPYTPPVERLPSETAFFFTGDTARESRSDQQRAIWEREPQNKAFFANYVSEFLTDDRAWNDETINEIRRESGKIDPENSRYDYLEAFLLTKRAGPVLVTSGRDWIVGARYVTTNQDLLAVAMDALARGNAKPAYKRYAHQMLLTRLRMLPEAKHVEEQAERLMMVSKAKSPDAAMLLQLALASSAYAEALLAEGKTTHAAGILDTWRHLAFKLNGDAFALDDIQIVTSIARVAETHVARLYEKAGMKDEADACRRVAMEVQACAQTGWPGAGAEGEDVERFGSVFAKLATVPTGHASVGTVMKEGRWAEFAVIEQAGVLALILTLTAALAASLAVASRWAGPLSQLGPSPSQTYPIWILFSRRQVAYLLGLAIALPLMIYYAYSRWTPVAAREFSLGYLPVRFVLEMVLMAITVLGCCSLLVSRLIRNRCADLNIPAPERIRSRYTIAFWCMVVLSWILCLSVRSELPGTGLGYVPVALAVAACTILLLRHGYLFLHALFSPRIYGMFYGTAARSSVILCGLVILMLSLVVYPALDWQEGRFLARQRRFSVNAGGNLANAEFAHVVKMKNAIGQLRGTVK